MDRKRSPSVPARYIEDVQAGVPADQIAQLHRLHRMVEPRTDGPVGVRRRGDGSSKHAAISMTDIAEVLVAGTAPPALDAVAVRRRSRSTEPASVDATLDG